MRGAVVAGFPGHANFCGHSRQRVVNGGTNCPSKEMCLLEVNLRKIYNTYF